FFFQAEDGIRDRNVTGVQTCALPISKASSPALRARSQPGRDLRPAMDGGPPTRDERDVSARQLDVFLLAAPDLVEERPDALGGRSEERRVGREGGGGWGGGRWRV